MPSFSALVTTATTTQLVAAPTRGYIAVYALAVSIKNTDGTVELKSGSNLKFGLHGASSGVVAMGCGGIEGHSEPYFLCDSATALTAVTSASGSVYINGSYAILGS